ncbi:MAG: TerB family tellurite resistance protein [Methylocella sp.]
MFDALKSFIAEVAGAEPPARNFGEEDYRLAAVALLIHVANVDGETDLAERRRLKTIIEERFDLDAKATSELIAMAEQSDREAVDLYHFTSVLKRALDDEGRHKIVEMLWDIAFADGVADEFEENAIWRIAELLGVSTRDRVLLRQRVAGQKPRDAPFQGPWSASASKGKE